MLNILGVTEDDIENMPYPDPSCFLHGRKPKPEKKDKPFTAYSDASSGTSLGETLLASGIDLSALTGEGE